MPDNKYFAKKMREYRLRKKLADPLYYKKIVYTITLNGQQYAVLERDDFKIQKTKKNELNHDCIKLY